jgi:hypothetical protein
VFFIPLVVLGFLVLFVLLVLLVLLVLVIRGSTASTGSVEAKKMMTQRGGIQQFRHRSAEAKIEDVGDWNSGIPEFRNLETREQRTGTKEKGIGIRISGAKQRINTWHAGFSEFRIEAQKQSIWR